MGKTKTQHENAIANINKAARNKYIRNYATALKKLEKDTWEVAKCVYMTVTAADFDQCFESREDYAKQIGLSVSTVSKMVNACERAALLPEGYSMTQISEMAKVDDNDIPDFVDEKKITPSSTCKQIRKAVKEWITVEDGESDAEEVTESDAEESTESENIIDGTITEQEVIPTILFDNGDYDWLIAAIKDVVKGGKSKSVMIVLDTM